MTLEALGRQYAAEADNLEGLIASCDERRRIAIRAGDSKEAHRLEDLAERHTLQRDDLLEIAANLRHYYDDSGCGQEEITTIKKDWVKI
ncbi:MAG: hypothetical protein FWF60_09235 [Oscillospiraceae bacterium]|nr:hypothetical protein [Oscillospiraceae bacterium]